ncbi:MAG: FAD:protein FMN transferase, partial [Ginsengibacter sp.]
GGDIVMSGSPPGRSGWIIGINVPESEKEISGTLLSIENRSVATSGDVYQFVSLKGKKYSHIIDPRKGLGDTKQRNVTVIASSGEQADWIATACSLLPLRKAKRLIKNHPGTAWLISEIKRGNIKSWKSKDFNNYILRN